jgi:hypothetical protein
MRLLLTTPLKVDNPPYAIDEQAAIQAIDRQVEVVSEYESLLLEPDDSFRPDAIIRPAVEPGPERR